MSRWTPHNFHQLTNTTTGRTMIFCDVLHDNYNTTK